MGKGRKHEDEFYLQNMINTNKELYSRVPELNIGDRIKFTTKYAESSKPARANPYGDIVTYSGKAIAVNNYFFTLQLEHYKESFPLVDFALGRYITKEIKRNKKVS